jgi:hypothetical protein
MSWQPRRRRPGPRPYVVLSTGEDMLPLGQRLSGHDVRLMQFPACVSDQSDVFDAQNALKIVGTTTDQRESFVNALAAAAYKFQGVALVEFVSWLVDDKDADRDIRRAVDEFIAQAPIPQGPSRKVFARMRRLIAAIYAGMALAIDYDILPFTKRETLCDLRSCMNDAINLLLANEPRRLPVLGHSDDQLVSRFRRYLRAAKFIKAGAHAQRDEPLTARQIEGAEGYINFAKPEKYRAMLQTHCLRIWFPVGAERTRLISILRTRNMLLPGRQADTCARQISLKPLSRKVPVYWLALKRFGLTLEDLQVS